MIILGIDPGSSRAGYGLIRKEKNGLSFIKAGLLKVSAKNKNQRLVDLEKSFSDLLKKERPDLAVLETIYFMKNLKTAVEVAQARGVLTLIIVKHKIPLLEYSPLKIKQSVTGYGRADKKAVAKMVSKILKTNDPGWIDDATDALAAAITGAHQKLPEF
ncbi:crossover junction endodeoxyribonuclease RuvC [Candidatus Wolfebacteria bacterium]|nr:crossover junction endodeoxyribonuclease RuvC [Candidatus Wolfebacteria bacterium]